MARNAITTVNKAVKMLKVIILAMFFELEISYAVSEVNKRYELIKFLRIEEEIEKEVKLRSVYNSANLRQFLNFVFSIINSNSKRKRNKPSL